MCIQGWHEVKASGFDNFEGIDVLSDQFRCKTDEYLKNVNDIDFLDNCKRLSTLMNIEEKSKNDEEMIQKFPNSRKKYFSI